MSSLLSIKLKQRARVLAAGVAVTAITLAMLPGVAEAAKKDSVGAVDAGGSVESAAPANSGGGKPISTETDAVSVNEVGEDGANTDTALNSDNAAPVPASVEATGDATVDSPVGSQNVEVCGDLNADACPQEAPGGGSGADGGNTADGGSEPITTATDLAGTQDVSEDGANGDTALVSDNTAPVPASGVVTADGEANTPVADQTGTLCIDLNAPNCVQQPADGPADGGSEPITTATDLAGTQDVSEDGANGDTALNSDNTAPVPASGVATGDAAVESPAGNQNVEACGDLNTAACPQEDPAGGSGADGGTAPTSDNPITSVTDVTGTQDVSEDGANGGTALNSDNTAPVPASGVVTSGVAVDSPAGNQNIEVCGDLNANACPQEEAATGTAPTNANPITSVTDLTGNQELGEDGLVGDTALNSENTAPVPASGVVTGNGNVTVPGVANEDLNLCATLNQNACTEEAAAPGNNAGGGGTSPASGIDVDSTTGIVQELVNGGLNGDTSNNTVINAPVPVNGSVVVGGNATVDEIANQNVGICLLVNRMGCGAATTPPAGGGNAGGGSGTPPNNGSPITSVTDIVGNQNVGPGGSTGTTVIDSVTTAPAVPASVLVNANGNAAVDGVLNQGIDACLAVNANCGQANAPGNNSGGTTPIGTTPIGTTPVGNAGGDNAGSGNNGGGNNGGATLTGNTGGTALGSTAPSGTTGGTNLGGNASGTTPGGSASGTTLGSTAPGDSANSTTNLGSKTSGGSASGTTTLGSMAVGGASNSSAIALAQQSSSGGSSGADGGSQASTSGGSQASAGGGSSSASSGSQEEASASLPSTGGVSPLLMIAMLLLIGSGIFFLIAMMRRSERLNS